MLKVPVGGDEDIEVLCRESQQFAVFYAAPADSSHGSYLVAGEQCRERARQDSSGRTRTGWQQLLGGEL